MSSFRKDQRGVFLLGIEIYIFFHVRKLIISHIWHLFPQPSLIMSRGSSPKKKGEAKAVDRPTVVALKVPPPPPPPPPLKTSCGLSERFVTPPPSLPFSLDGRGFAPYVQEGGGGGRKLTCNFVTLAGGEGMVWCFFSWESRVSACPRLLRKMTCGDVGLIPPFPPYPAHPPSLYAKEGKEHIDHKIFPPSLREWGSIPGYAGTIFP